MKYENIRKQVLDAILEAVEKGLINGTSGNIALRDDTDDVIAITPSGIPYKGMTTETLRLLIWTANGWKAISSLHRKFRCIRLFFAHGRM